MPTCDILLSDIIAAFITFVAGLIWPRLPKSYQAYLLRQFWGKGVQEDAFAIVYGVLIPSQRMKSGDPYSYVKTYRTGKRFRLAGPVKVVGECELRCASYIINALSRYRDAPVTLLSDEAALRALDRTLVALGSPSSNQLTDLMLRDRQNELLDFGQEGTGEKATIFIRDKRTGKRFVGFQKPAPKDYGLIVRIPNQRFPGHFLFACAGLGEWGSSGASWYLSTKWRSLHKEFKGAFGIIVEVELGSDKSARRVCP